MDSVLTFNGKEYWSKELATKLVPDNKSVSRKDDCIYVGNIVAEASNLFDMHINDSSTAWLKRYGYRFLWKCSFERAYIL